MSADAIRIRGAREHNLQGVDLDVPRNRLVLFTGVSGSGKSSLAFDTLFAEGQRRYVESLSAYARQFLGQLDKPHYDSIQGLTPTIAVSQQAAGKSPRSTLATQTEVHDHLRVLFARAGIQHCTGCGQPVGRQSAAEITRALLSLTGGTKFSLLAPLFRQRKGGQEALLDEVRKAGFSRLRVDGRLVLLEELGPLDARRPHDVDVVVDRLRMREGLGERLADSVETTLKLGQGVLIAAVEGGDERLFSERLACPTCGLSFPELSPQSFSFNSPLGMCPACQGLGRRHALDPALVVPDPALSLRGGAIAPWAKVLANPKSWNSRMFEALGRQHGFDLETPWRALPEDIQRLILHGTGAGSFQVAWQSERIEGRVTLDWEGVLPTLMRRLSETKSEGQRRFYMSFMGDARCEACGGGRLRPESAAVRVGPHTLPALTAMTVAEARGAVEGLDLPGARAAIAQELIAGIGQRLRFLQEVGLGYLSLDRGGATLSGGESQRIRLASQLGGELTGVTYVLDEPSIGLHPRDNARLVATLQRLRDAGNTVVVVEHERETILAADHVFDFGPGAGQQGGRIVCSGTPAELMACPGSLTGQYLAGLRQVPVPAARRAPGQRRLRLVGVRENNLCELTVDIPLGLLVAVTGVSGAGKSSLVEHVLSPALHNRLHGASRPVGAHDRIEGLQHLSKVIDVDQAPIGRSPRSNPATYTKAWDLIRGLFAKTKEARVRGYGAERFSFNKKGGRCEACTGDGYRRIEMHFLADVFVPCEVCGGRRFDESTLAVRYRGHDIAQVLAMSVDSALALFAAHPKLARILQTLSDVGLGYLSLGQPANTLSGGEAQRIKLAAELARPSDGRALYLLDEPTTGLHFEDVRRLVAMLDRLVAGGDTVLVVEHDLDVIKAADWVIDLGPEGGSGGGRVVTEGPPEVVAGCAASHTGRFLQGALGSWTHDGPAWRQGRAHPTVAEISRDHP
ncbi:MAG: excinuclease ABC subunit UvrA [Pseudomonadota bacterium]